MANVSLKKVLADHPSCGDGKSFKKLIDSCSVKPANPNNLKNWDGVVHPKVKFIVCGSSGTIAKTEI